MNVPLSLDAWLFATTAVGLVALLVIAYARRGSKSGLGRRALTVAALALGPAVAALCVDWGLDKAWENAEPQGSAVMAMAVSPDGTKVATADISGRTRIYDLSHGGYVAGPSFAGVTQRVAALHMLKGAAGKDLLVAISDQSSFAIAGTDGQPSEPAVDDARPYLMSLAVGNGLFVVEKWTPPANAQQSAPSNEFDVKYIDFRDAMPWPISHVLVRPTAMAIVMPVARLQAALAAFGNKDLPVDGIVGPKTLDAIDQFQRQNGLRVTGSIDTATISKILELNLADIGSLQILLGFADGRIAMADRFLQGPITSFSLDTSNLSKDPQAPAPRPILRIAGNGAGRIATADADGHLSLWTTDPKSGQPEKDVNFEAATEIVLAGLNKKSVRDASFSPDGIRIVTASSDKTVRLWNAANGALLTTLSGHTEAVNAARFSPDGRQIATASSDGTARLWDTASGSPLATFSGHTGWVDDVAFSPDGTRVVTASQDGTARLWDVATGRQIAALTGHRAMVRKATFSSDGSRIVTASMDGTAQLWDGTTGSNLTTLTGHDGNILAASLSPDGRRIVTASTDFTGRLWSALYGRPLVTLSGHTDSVDAAAFSPDGARVATGSIDRTARLWDSATGRLLATLSGHTNTVSDLAFSPDGGRLVTASYDGTLRIWNSTNGDSMAVVQTSGMALKVTFSPDGRFIVAVVNGVADTRVWDAFTGLPAKTAPCIGCLSLRFNVSGGSTIEATDYTGRTRRFDAQSGKMIGEGVAWAQGHVVALDDGRYIDSRADGSVFVYDPVAGAKTELVAHTAMISSAGALPDGRIVTASIDGTIHIVDPAMQSYLAAVDPWPALQSGANALGAGLQSLYGSAGEMAASLRQRFAPAPGGITPPASDAPPAADVAPAATVSPPAAVN